MMWAININHTIINSSTASGLYYSIKRSTFSSKALPSKISGYRPDIYIAINTYVAIYVAIWLDIASHDYVATKSTKISTHTVFENVTQLVKDLHQYWDTETVGISPESKKSREGIIYGDKI